MKPITINVQISKCPKQYESIRLGGEWMVEDGETPEDVMRQAIDTLNKFYDEQTGAKPKEQPQPKSEAKKPLHINTDASTIQSIVKRIESGVKLEKVLEFYEPDNEVLNVLKLAAETNK